MEIKKKEKVRLVVEIDRELRDKLKHFAELNGYTMKWLILRELKKFLR